MTNGAAVLPNKYGILRSGKYGIPYCEALRLLLSAGFAATVYFDPIDLGSDPGFWIWLR